MIVDILQGDLWKTIGSSLPMLIAILKGCQYIYQTLRNGRIVKLRSLYKEYGEHLSCDDKKLISKILNKKIMAQIVGVTNDINRNGLIYIMARCDLNMPIYKISLLSKYLMFDGKRFYFSMSRGYKIKRWVALLTGIVYLYLCYDSLLDVYCYMPSFHLVYFEMMFSVIFFMVSVFMLTVYPSLKRIQSINGKMLKVDSYKYNSRMGGD